MLFSPPPPSQQPPPQQQPLPSATSPTSPAYGSPNQNARAQQSRHQLAASSYSAANSPLCRSVAHSPAALDQPDPLLHAAPLAQNPLGLLGDGDHHLDTSAWPDKAEPDASATTGDLADQDRQSATLSAYPSIQDIRAEAARHQQYYYSPDQASFSRQPYAIPTGKKNRFSKQPSRRVPLVRNYDSFRSVAHPFENYSDNGDTDRRGPFYRLAQTASELGRSMYASGTGGRSGGVLNGGAGEGAAAARGAAAGRSSKLPGAELYSTLRWSSERPPMTKERKLLLLRSYLPDWIITIALAGFLALINKVHGFRREFDLTDTSIQHTHALDERVPVWLLALTVVVVPALIIAGISLGISRSVWDLHNGLLGFLLAHCLTVTITTVIKVTVGRPRPDLIDRCQPLAGVTNAVPYGLVTDAICTVSVDDSELRDGFRSFPSGHASSAFAGLAYLTLWLAGKVHLFDRRGHALSAWLICLPLLGAALIAVSRTMDYRHHATDVIAGGLLGLVVAFWVYRLYYPPLSHPQCHKPYSPRIPRDGIATRHGDDLEDGDVGSELDDAASSHGGGGGGGGGGGAGARGGGARGHYAAAPHGHGVGPGSRSDARMLSAAQGVVHSYESRHDGGAKQSLEDEYVPETINRI